jgi:hypothetical protein
MNQDLLNLLFTAGGYGVGSMVAPGIGGTTGAGVGSYLASLFNQPKDLQTDYWKQYYDPARVNMITQPAIQNVKANLINQTGASGEMWGGKGLETSAGSTAARQDLQSKANQDIANITAQATAGELGTASSLGLSNWLKNYESSVANKGQMASLGGELLKPFISNIATKHATEMQKKYFSNPEVQSALINLFKLKQGGQLGDTEFSAMMNALLGQVTGEVK